MSNPSYLKESTKENALADHEQAGARILVVDDDIVVHAMVKGILKKFGFEYFGVHSAIEALDKIREIEPELIMSDVSMPNIDGIEFCERLKANSSLNEIPVIFFTAHSDPDILARAFEAGACDFLVKPLKPFELSSRAQHHIHQFRKAKQAKDKIHHLDTKNQTMVKFLGVASHDLRNPLVSIRGISSQLQSKSFGELTPIQSELVDAINQSSEAMLSLVEELLEVSKFNESLKQINPVPNNIQSILKLAVTLHSSYAIHKKIQITTTGDQEVPTVLIERKLITRVIDNLISNAIKFSPEDTQITIALSQVDRFVNVAIKDEGPGIPEDEFSLLFKEFSKTSNQPTAGEASNGLGLYVCKSIIDAHGGTISVRNRKTKGAEFRIQLPTSLPK